MHDEEETDSPRADTDPEPEDPEPGKPDPEPLDPEPKGRFRASGARRRGAAFSLVEVLMFTVISVSFLVGLLVLYKWAVDEYKSQALSDTLILVERNGLLETGGGNKPIWLEGHFFTPGTGNPGTRSDRIDVGEHPKIARMLGLKRLVVPGDKVEVFGTNTLLSSLRVVSTPTPPGGWDQAQCVGAGGFWRGPPVSLCVQRGSDPLYSLALSIDSTDPGLAERCVAAAKKVTDMSEPIQSYVDPYVGDWFERYGNGHGADANEKFANSSHVVFCESYPRQRGSSMLVSFKQIYITCPTCL